MSPREHLMNHHLTAATHCAKCARLHHDVAQHHAAIARSIDKSEPDQAREHAALAESHRSLGDSFVEMGEHHAESARALQPQPAEKTAIDFHLAGILGGDSC
jgi:hypothetical protein